ncbi:MULTISPECIES: GntR family transcriptional regulator [Sphingobium]|jgi:DNA-binding GntR family transcriptional regulator|uniref:GntR family transcriptional regulator n=4 Tax=Sphingomonadaceae TaxID=41297 RepID=A0ABQ1F352_SPHSA|nr:MULTISPECIES: GntR family transcriptional regulator [Sphingobium]AJR23604.1 GntR family transcriptional regulator [Sphingobium sp. YBL2]OAP30096.1 GntR family transcriptional regulator [Sphingobium sp. 20006FA]QDC39586.1 GntR family transcriptional regulator [Sphingobium fuliginis ATCC 27551]UXC93345.1 GntR family transcriptional regulator [Sphingobium sp. RSMS]KXU30538.1 GntR family transcriptional regulator [Sphingobium sp. AM]
MSDLHNMSQPAGALGSPARAASGPTLVERAYEHLLSMLMTVKIAPGERIPIDTVARQLGISQTPIREALSQLEAEKLVYKTTNVGYRASPQMTPEEVHDLYTLRLLIEPYAAARAAEQIDDETLSVLQSIQADMDAVVERDEQAYARFAEADAQLHRLIAKGSGNRLIEETIERLHAHLQIFRSLYQNSAQPNAPEVAAREHQAIIAALLAHDPVAAEQSVRDHLTCSQQRMDRANGTSRR